MTPMSDEFNAMLRGIDMTGLPPAEEPVYQCELCRDLAWRQNDAGLAEPCDCSRRRMAELRPEKLRRHWEEVSGVETRCRGFRLQTHPHLSAAVQRRMLASEYATASWYLWGVPGGGKTGAAAGYAWEFLQATGASICWRYVPDLLDDIKATFGREDGGDTEALVKRRLTGCGLLVLDDLGANRATEWAIEQLTQIIQSRYAASLPVVVTSNLSPVRLTETYGARLVRRLGEMCDGRVVEIAAAG